MKIIKSEVWDVVSSGEKELVFNGNKEGDTVASELYVNTLSNCNVVVKGFCGPDDTTGKELACVDSANLEKVSSVTNAGVYCYMVGSFYKVKITATGTSKILIKYLF